MRIIIKITKQEAIDAWKKQNEHISTGEDTTVEIEDIVNIPYVDNTAIRTGDNPFYYTTS